MRRDSGRGGEAEVKLRNDSAAELVTHVASEEACQCACVFMARVKDDQCALPETCSGKVGGGDGLCVIAKACKECASAAAGGQLWISCADHHEGFTDACEFRNGNQRGVTVGEADANGVTSGGGAGDFRGVRGGALRIDALGVEAECGRAIVFSDGKLRAAHGAETDGRHGTGLGGEDSEVGGRGCQRGGWRGRCVGCGRRDACVRSAGCDEACAGDGGGANDGGDAAANGVHLGLHVGDRMKRRVDAVRRRWAGI